MDHKQILRALDSQRRNLVRDGESVEVLPEVTRLTIAGLHHMVKFSALSNSNANAIIEREVAHHRKLSAPFEWKLYSHDSPADLRERLAAHGFSIGPCEAVMIRELSGGLDWTGDLEHRVLKVDSLELIETYRRLAKRIFLKDHDFIADEMANALNSNSTQHRGYLGYSGGEPVSMGRLYTHPESIFAGLYGGGTLKEFRGRGHYRALIAARARDAVAAGAKYLIVDALPTSRPILERLGFECVTHTYPCEWRPE